MKSLHGFWLFWPCKKLYIYSNILKVCHMVQKKKKLDEFELRRSNVVPETLDYC